MFPVELRLGPFAINAHGVMTVVGIWLGWVLARVEARRKTLDPVFLDNLALAVVLGGLVGARLSFLLFENLPAVLRDPWSALRIWEGGVGLQGGVLGGLVVGLWYCRRHGMPPGPYADAVVPGSGGPAPGDQTGGSGADGTAVRGTGRQAHRRGQSASRRCPEPR